MVEEQRGGPQSVFNQPAGHIEPGEGPVAAILREVVEETAWQVSLTGYLGLYVFHTSTGETFHSHGFIAEPLQQLDLPSTRISSPPTGLPLSKYARLISRRAYAARWYSNVSRMHSAGLAIPYQ